MINQRTLMNCGRLELILGPMFAGKSTKLIEVANRYESINKRILTVTHIIDNRYGEGVISSHNKIQKQCITTEFLLNIIQMNNAYSMSEIIVIEEGQFFTDLKEFVIKAVDIDNKHVIVAGLSGDYQRKPFGQILELIPMADNVQMISAFCKICNDGTEAHFTKRISSNTDSTILVGCNDIYMPVCRKHFLEK